MTTMLRATAIAGVVALAGLAVAPVLAQDGPPQGRPPMGRRGPGGPGGFGMGPGPGGPMGLLGDIGRGLRALNITDAQREQIRSIAEARQAEFKEIGDRLRAATEGVNALVTADTVDESAIRARSGDVAAVQADAAVMRARVHQEVFSILTAEQQAKAKELRAQAEARAKERAGKFRERRQRRQGQ